MKYVHFFMPHIVLFSVFLVVLTWMLYFYRNKNPHPRLRPRAGEIAVLAVIGLVLGGFACYGLGNVFRGDIDFKTWQGTVDYGSGWSEGDSGPQVEDSRYSR